MGNTATQMTPLGVNFYGQAIIPVRINYDTINQDLQIALFAGKSVFLVGMELVKGAAYNPIFKTGSVPLIKYELAANSGRVEPFCPSRPRIICNTEPGEALNLTCDVALPPFLLYVAPWGG